MGQDRKTGALELVGPLAIWTSGQSHGDQVKIDQVWLADALREHFALPGRGLNVHSGQGPRVRLRVELVEDDSPAAAPAVSHT